MTLYDALIGPFAEFSFMRRALAGSLALSLSSAPLGAFLLLRRMSLIGDAMSHAILPGAAIGYLVSGFSLGAMTVGGLGAGLAVAILAGIISRITILREDAAIAAFYILSLAAGITLLSVKGSNVDIFRVLFGSILGLDDATLMLISSVSTVTLVALALLLRPLVVEFVDPLFLASQSRVGSYAYIAFLSLTVLNLVAAFHALGTLLSVGILIMPAAAARLCTPSLGQMLALSVVYAFAACLAGLLISYHWALPSGPTIILCTGGIYIAALIVGPAGGMMKTLRPAKRHLRG